MCNFVMQHLLCGSMCFAEMCPIMCFGVCLEWPGLRPSRSPTLVAKLLFCFIMWPLSFDMCFFEL